MSYIKDISMKLFRGMDTYLPTVSPKILPKLSSYVRFLNFRRGLVLNRYDASWGANSKAVNTLSYIINNVDIDKLLSMRDDLDRYFNYLVPIQDVLNGMFDTVATGITYLNTFIHYGGSRCAEYLIPISCDNYLSDLPMDEKWESWQDIRAVRLFDVDSNELTFHTYKDQILFKHDHPSRVVIGIDVIALVLQYVKYLQSRPDDDQTTLARYVHQYVLRGLLQDLEDLWLRNRYISIIKGTMTRPDKNASLHENDNNLYGYIGPEYAGAMEEVIRQVENCKNGTVSPAMLLSSLRLSDYDVTYYIRNILAKNEAVNVRQYFYLTYLKDIKWLDLVFSVYSLNTSGVVYRNFVNSLRRDFPVMTSTRFWNMIYDADTRSYVEQSVKYHTDTFAKSWKPNTQE
ncbi:unnamed protein product [Sphagnum balticum]